MERIRQYRAVVRLLCSGLDELTREDPSAGLVTGVCRNDSALTELGDEPLKAISKELVDVVRSNATIDWDKKEQAWASLRRHVRQLLAKYRYPPDKQEGAVLLVMRPAKPFAGEVAA